jgi:hypothetical protein
MIPEDLTDLTAPALRKLAAEHNVKGRSTMTKPALIAALSTIRFEFERSARIVARVPEEAVQQAARDDEAITVDALTFPSVVGESGPEIKDLPAGSAVKPNDHTTGMSIDMERFNSAELRIFEPDGSMTVTFPKRADLTAMSIGNKDHFKNVASYLDRMNDTIDSFHMRAAERYLRDGRKRLTARQARRVGKKVNALMGRMGINA